VAQSESSFEQFVSETFDAEEAVAVALALRAHSSPVSVTQLVEDLEQKMGFQFDEPRRLTEKRLELRLRDLATRQIVQRVGDHFAYRADRWTEGLMARVASEFETRRVELNRLIYSTTTKARRLAEAFRV
jgi:hypothetical protein